MSQASQQDTEVAVRAFLKAIGCDVAADFKETPARVAVMWHEYLLKGAAQDLGKVLGHGMPTNQSQAVQLRDISVHLVCPHHLTVAFGVAHVGYVPSNRLAGLGCLVDLVEACTARLVLQETATTQIADALVTYLGAHASIAIIEAKHPCHNVTRPKAHHSRVLTTATAGDPIYINELREMITSDCN